MKYIAYYRVSTARQGKSGLGLDGQRSAVESFCKPVAEFTEVETGTNKRKRPQLQRAILECQKQGATLVIAKLDRLARNVHFISGLMESGIEFIACDMPTANRFTAHIMAAVAENEARAISERTKAALQAAKARGKKLGTPENLPGADVGCQANSQAAASYAEQVKPFAEALRTAGRTLAEIADTLTERGILTRRGKAWSPTAVMRLLA